MKELNYLTMQQLKYIVKKICNSIKRTGHMLTYKNSRFKKCRRASTKYRGNKRWLKQKFDPDVP